MRWVPKLQLSIGSSFNKEQLVWWISGSWSTRGKLAGDIGRSVFCCLMSFLDTTATSSSHFPSAVGIFQVSCCLRNWWTEYTSLASTSQQQPANGHHLPNHKVILYGNSILWPSRYCSSPNLLASWCAAMTAMTVQLAVIGKAARAQRREGPRVPYASWQISPWGRNWTYWTNYVLSLMFCLCYSILFICQSFHVWCCLAQRSSQERTMKELLHRNYHRECNFWRCLKADLNRHHFLTQKLHQPPQLKYMRSKPDPWFLLLTCPFFPLIFVVQSSQAHVDRSFHCHPSLKALMDLLPALSGQCSEVPSTWAWRKSTNIFLRWKQVETKAPKSYQGISTKINKMFIIVLRTRP